MFRRFLTCLLLCLTNVVWAEDPIHTGPIRVALFVDAGVGGKGPEYLERALDKEHGFQTQRVTAAEIRNGVLKDYALLIHPGGSGGGQAKTLGEEGREKEKTFVKAGGGYLGICAGAYLASADYDWSLHILDAKVLDRQHWARGSGEVKLALNKEGRAVFATEQEETAVLYHQGPLLAPGGKDDIADYEELATFATEIAQNGAPTGVMRGTTAMARGRFGEGRVFCISPHPEQDERYADTIRTIARWTARAAVAKPQEANAKQP
ncbi:MAG: BPL-N domain-containing protein [Pirellulales bacterium]